MSTITRAVGPRKPVFGISADDDRDPMDVCREVTLSTGDTLLSQAMALRGHFQAATGRDLDWRLTLHCLDLLRTEQASKPMPDALAPVADWLVRQWYGPEAVHEILRHIRRTGTAAGCVWLDGEDVEPVEEIIRKGGVA